MNHIYPNLNLSLNQKGISVSLLAGELNISETEVIDKLNGKSKWYLSEVITICVMLNSSDINFLFHPIRF